LAAALLSDLAVTSNAAEEASMASNGTPRARSGSSSGTSRASVTRSSVRARSSARGPSLCLAVAKAEGLAKKDIFGASDPYVKVAVIKPHASSSDDPETVAVTQKKKRTLNPTWNETFTVDDPKGDRFVSGAKLVFSVFDANRLTRDDFLGQVEVPVSQMETVQSSASLSQSLISAQLMPRSAKSRVQGRLSYRAVLLEPSANGSVRQGQQRNQPRVRRTLTECP